MLTGDLAVRHPDGYVEIRDRQRDIIISLAQSQTLAPQAAQVPVS